MRLLTVLRLLTALQNILGAADAVCPLLQAAYSTSTAATEPLLLLQQIEEFEGMISMAKTKIKELCSSKTSGLSELIAQLLDV